MDRWKLKEIKQMELGGNKSAQIYFEKNNMYADGKPNHKAPALSKYKQDLLKKVEMEISSAAGAGGFQTQGSAVFSQNSDNIKQIYGPNSDGQKFGSDNAFESKNSFG